jgi:hypothetical protein
VTAITLEREQLAEEVVTDILRGKFPNLNSLKDLYGHDRLWNVSDTIEHFLELSIDSYLAAGNKLRHLVDIRNSDIFIKHQESQSSNIFFEMEKRINKWELPDKDQMKDFYGDYYVFVTKSFREFQKLRKDRNCERPYVNHLLRTSAMAKTLGFDAKSGKPAKYYTALWALHDTVEELLYDIRKDNGRRKYGLESISDFLNDYVPRDMQEDIMMVTNKNDIILDHLKAKRFSLETKKEMDLSLASLLKEEKYGFIHEDVIKARDVLGNINIKSGREAFEIDVRWSFYRKLFIDGLAETAYERNHFALFEGKGCVDLLDNCTSILPENIRRARRAMLKIRLWADEADEIILRAKEQNKAPPIYFQENVWQTMNYANYAARKFLISYFAEPVSQSGHLDAALKSINILKPVLYTNR